MRWPMIVLAGLCVARRVDGAAVAAHARAGGGDDVIPGTSARGRRGGHARRGRRAVDGRHVRIIRPARADRALAYIAAKAAGRPPGGTGRHLGLRLRRAHAANAVHGIVLRPAAGAVVPPVSPTARRDTPAGRAVSPAAGLHTHTPDVFRR